MNVFSGSGSLFGTALGVLRQEKIMPIYPLPAAIGAVGSSVLPPRGGIFRAQPHAGIDKAQRPPGSERFPGKRERPRR